MMDIVSGPGYIAAWDQTQHEALVRLRDRNCRAFVLVTLDEEHENPRMVAASRDLTPTEMAYVFAVTAQQTLADAEALADEDDRAA